MRVPHSAQYEMTTLAILLLGSLAAAGQAVPADSLIGRNAENLQRVPVGLMEPGDRIGQGGWRMKAFRVEPADRKDAKVGRDALVFAGTAEVSGAKGDFTVNGWLSGQTAALGLWVYLDEGANVEKVGIQVYDGEGEALMMLRRADWVGWKWVEFATTGEHVRQSYPQKDRNGRIDAPLRSQNVVWFAKAPGATRMVVDGMVALVDRSKLGGKAEVTIGALGPDIVEPGGSVPVSLLLVNYANEPVAVDAAYSFQRASALYAQPVPDPVHGSNHATGCKSWTVADGETIETGSLTDGQRWTDAGTAYKKDHFTEAFQFVDLGKVRRITKMRWLSGDANHTWFVDVWVSRDGKTFTAVRGLQDVDQHKKWGWVDYPVTSPVEARVIRFRYHTGDEARKVPAIRFPAELAVCDGVADERMEIPRVGPVLDDGRAKATVPARSFHLLAIPAKATLDAGACFVGIDASWPGRRALAYRHVFADLTPDASGVSAESRFGLNVAHAPLAPRLRDLGIGWVRFENMKWPFVSPAPQTYAFDGSVKPWQVDTDAIFQAYHRNGLNVLSYMFMTPQWASTAPPDARPDRVLFFPPKDPALFGEFCFQVAARYGNTKHPAAALRSNDKKSGLGLVHYYEMWNEPGLNPSPKATWGGWSAPLDEYYRMMRYGAEAVKKADPTATVTSAGYAGITTEIVNRLRTYKYPDGKCPLDFVEVLNVHYYSGQKPPETSVEDGNARAVGQTTFSEDLEDLRAWRDRYAPKMPIWMTETGYDSAGPFGTNETIQSARLPRVVMLCLAAGVDKVFVYRESGSTPSMHACSGLLRDDFTAKPSWFTFAALLRQFRRVKGPAVRLPHRDPNVWLLKWNEAGKDLLTAWTVNGRAPLGLDFGPCEITDAFGARRNAASTAELGLTPFPVYIRKMSGSDAWRTLLAAYESQRRDRQRRRQRAAACRKYLYDFGTTDRVGTHRMEGIEFPYTPVRAADVWDEAKGYGFDKKALGDENRLWVRSKLDGDGSRTYQGTPFRFRVEAGAYRLAVGFSGHSSEPKLTVAGLAEPLTLPLDKRTSAAEAEVVLAEPAALSVFVAKGYAEIRWVRLVEKP
ncbi:MAG: hypothetical protein WBF17_19480 [Phycisphaerae bacterium]